MNGQQRDFWRFSASSIYGTRQQGHAEGPSPLMIGGGGLRPQKKKKEEKRKRNKKRKRKKKNIIRIKRIKLSKTINDRTENNKSER